MERRSRIGRLGGFGREGRRRCSRSAAARGRGATGVRPSVAPGVNPTRAWVGWHPRGMRKPLEAKAWLGRAWAGLATARGGRRGGASPACGVPGAKAVYGPSYLAKATREALGAHLRARGGRGRGGGATAARVAGGARTEFGAWPMEGSSGRPGSTGRALALLRNRSEGQGSPRVKDGEQIGRRPLTCSSAPG